MTKDATRLRQQRLREKRKEDGWRRVSIWLDPTEARTLESLGDEWLGRTVKGLLSDAMAPKGQPQGNAQKPLDLGTDAVSGNGGAVSGNASPDYETVLAEAARLLDSGMSGEAVARELNKRGWCSKTGAVLRGGNLKRDVQMREQRGAGE
jgi:hypothetical protein